MKDVKLQVQNAKLQTSSNSQAPNVELETWNLFGTWRLALGTSRVYSRRAFSLTEVMFAVIVLGIGLILVAAIFPVAVSQSKLTVEETSAAAIARSALATSSRIAEGSDTKPTGAPATWRQILPTTDLIVAAPTGPSLTAGTAPAPAANTSILVRGKVLSFFDPRVDPTYQADLWQAFKTSLIAPSDPRYAWVPLYRRDVTYVNSGAVSAIAAPFAQIYFLPVAVRNRSVYDTNTGATGQDLNTGAGLNNLIPRLVGVTIVPSNVTTNVSGVDLIYIKKSSTAGVPDYSLSAAEGSFVVISDDRITAASATDQGLMNGHVFRIGNRRPDLDDPSPAGLGIGWELAPGGGFSGDAGADGINNTADDINAIGVAMTPAQTATSTTSTVVAAGPAEAFIVGRNENGAAFEGVAQDVSAYVTFVKVN